ncbi:MAG: YlmH/Sll1252 family protein [Bacteroides sp.]|nr:YlmH/Sll1252 family protein [Bacteroides sp.]
MKAVLPANSEETEFCRHIKDLALLGEKTFAPRFSGFLTEREQRLAETAAYSAGVSCAFWGGHEAASRKMFSAPAVENEDFPLEAVTFFFREKDKLTHRDFLGAIMSLGLKRDRIGDIAVTEGGAVVFASKNASLLISSEMEKVGRVGVRAEAGINIPLPQQEFEEISAVIASPRIDALVAAACSISREKAAALIKSGGVTLGGAELGSPSKNVDEGESFSVRGYGKFIFSRLGIATKKGKNHALIQKYK